MAPVPERPLSKAESKSLDAIESGFTAEHWARRRRRLMGLVAMFVTAVLAIGLIAPTPALVLCALVALAFAGPLMVALWSRALGLDDGRREAKIRLTARRRLRRR
jgi:fatty acid desaturase